MTSALKGSLSQNNPFFNESRRPLSLGSRGKATGRQVLQRRPVQISTAAAAPLHHTFPATHNLYFAKTAPPIEGLALRARPRS